MKESGESVILVKFFVGKLLLYLSAMGYFPGYGQVYISIFKNKENPSPDCRDNFTAMIKIGYNFWTIAGDYMILARRSDWESQWDWRIDISPNIKGDNVPLDLIRNILPIYLPEEASADNMRPNK